MKKIVMLDSIKYIMMLAVTTFIIFAYLLFYNFGLDFFIRFGESDAFLLHPGVDIFISGKQFANMGGGSDCFSYIRGAFVFAEHGFSLTKLGQGWGLWLPGMYVLNHIVTLITPNGYHPLMLLFIACLIWGNFILCFTFFCIKSGMNNKVLTYFIILCVIIFFPLFSQNTIFHFALFSEPTSFGLFFTAIVLLICYLKNYCNQFIAIVACILLVLATFFKSHLFVITNIIIFGTLFTILFSAKISEINYKTQIKKIIFIILLYSIPMQLYFAWDNSILNINYGYGQNWLSDKELSNFYIRSGVNVYREVNPQQAQEFDMRRELGEIITIDEQKNAVWNTIFQYPFSYIYKQTKNYLYFFFQPIWSYFLVCALLVAMYSMYKRDKTSCIYTLLLGIFIFIGSAGPNYLHHFEWRYLFSFYMIMAFVITYELLFRISYINLNGEKK